MDANALLEMRRKRKIIRADDGADQRRAGKVHSAGEMGKKLRPLLLRHRFLRRVKLNYRIDVHQVDTAKRVHCNQHCLRRCQEVVQDALAVFRRRRSLNAKGSLPKLLV